MDKSIDWFWGLVLGDFNEEPDAAQIIVGAIIGSLPIIGQAADIRDLCANCYQLSKDPKDKWKWIALVITLLAFIPGVGDALKGIAKFALKSLKSGGAQAAEAVKDILAVARGLGKGDPVQWLRSLPWNKYQADVLHYWGRITTNLVDAIESVRHSWLARWVLREKLSALDAALRQIQELAKLGHAKIPEAMTQLREEIDQLLKRAAPEEIKGASGTTNVLQHSSKPLKRIEYELAVKRIGDRVKEMRAAGKPDSDIAAFAVQERRKIGLESKNKTDPGLREIIYGRNKEKYQDELGPKYVRSADGKGWEYKSFNAKTGSFDNIKVSDEKAIEKACQAGGDDFPWGKVLEYDDAVRKGDGTRQRELLDTIKKVIALQGKKSGALKQGDTKLADQIQSQIDGLLKGK